MRHERGAIQDGQRTTDNGQRTKTMMNWIVSTSLRLRVMVLALSVVLMIVGIQRARHAPLDVFLEFSPLSSTSRLLKIGVSSQTLSQMDLTLLAKWTIRPRLMAIPGVANVAIWGQRDRQYQVLVDPDRLRLNGVTLDTVVKAVTDASA